ncbi:MAG: hypothetical protein M1546_08570 [Chloroflexi bacterium]|nr:hypothetical protein [Chloroflexota bacterium]
MENSIDPIVAVSASYVPVQVQGVGARGRATDVLPVTVAGVWHSTLATLSARPVPILTCALVGFALPNILAVLAGTALTLDMYGRTGTLFISFGLSRTVPMLVQALLGSLAGVLAHGAVAWFALHGDRDYTTPAGLRATLSRVPLLLLALLLTGGVIFIGNLGVGALLREFRIDLGDAGQLSMTYDGVSRSLVLRTIGALIPEPGAPFNELLSYIRLEASRVSTSLVYAGGFSFYRVKRIEEIPLPWLVGAGSLLLLVGSDALLRFTTAALMDTPATRGWLAIAGALRLAGRKFWLVLRHIWLVRLAIFGVSTVFIMLPMVLVQNMLLPLLIRSMGGPWVYLAATVLISTSLALVSMVLTAFSIVYETCLYRALAGGRHQTGL